MARATPELTAEFFETMMELDPPWFVDHISFDASKRRLVLYIDFEPGGTFTCDTCGTEGCRAYDSFLRKWRHLDFWGLRTVLSAPAPRVKCPRCGVKQARVPWARSRRRFTQQFEEFVVDLADEMPVRAVARILGEHDTRIGRLVNHPSVATGTRAR